ncbi:MAG: helix-turn-helix domain-containing protein [Nocardiopsaceae bacterium]|jgi:DNA-binding transcriptional ArsR family regulator|nr:helix-turn-helix domain-containing protein [Nocardiopsaceae bacterium]
MKKFGASADEAASGGGSAGTPHAPQVSLDAQETSHVDVLKVLADPLRLNILYALTRRRGPDLPAKTVKELAAELGEPQTKLYRHIKHLEGAGLIRSVSSRVVSGIVEHRYQMTSADMTLGDELTDSEKAGPEAEALAAAALELYRRQFFATRRARPRDPVAEEAEPHRRMVIAVADGWVPAARAAAIYDLMYQLLDEVSSARLDRVAENAEDLVPVNLLIGYFTDDPPAD